MKAASSAINLLVKNIAVQPAVTKYNDNVF